MLVGRLRDGRVSVLFADMVARGRGVSRRCQPNGRRSGFDPCMPGWFGVGRLACGLFTVKWRVQLRCGWCVVVLAASWSARSAWVSLPLPVVVLSNVVCAAHTSVVALASCVLVGSRAA